MIVQICLGLFSITSDRILQCEDCVEFLGAIKTVAKEKGNYISFTSYLFLDILKESDRNNLNCISYSPTLFLILM